MSDTRKNAKPTVNSGQQRNKDLNNMLINGSISQPSYQRLSSLAPPRDLRLGGNKKVFTPNLNVVRNKNVNVKTSKDMTAVRGRGRGRGSGNSDRGRGGGARMAAGLIQTTGVFSEGAGTLPGGRVGSGSNGLGRSSAGDESKQLRKPMLVKSEMKQQKGEKCASGTDIEKKVREVLGEDEESFFDDKTDINMRPVRLQQSTWNIKPHMVKREIKVEIDDELTAKSDVSASDMAKQFKDMHVQLHEKRRKQELVELQHEQEKFFRPQNTDEFLESKTAQLFLLKLPEDMPCDLDDADAEWEAKRVKKEMAEESAGTETPATTTSSTQPITREDSSSPLTTCTERLFRQKPMPGGRVGKLLRYKSGKVKLVLGSTPFDLDMGLDTGTPQDLMLIGVDKQTLTGNIAKLGPLRANFTAEPDWDYLFQHATRVNTK